MNLKICELQNISNSTYSLRKNNNINREINNTSVSFNGRISSKAIRNTMLGLLSVGTLYSCNLSQAESKDNSATVITVSDMIQGKADKSFSLSENPKTNKVYHVNDSDNIVFQTLIDDNIRTSVKTCNHGKTIRRDYFDNGESIGYEQTTYNNDGTSEYKVFGHYNMNDNYGVETYYAKYDADGNLLYWDDKLVNGKNASIKDNSITYYDNDLQKDGCIRHIVRDDYGDIKDDYFISKNGIKTSASVLDNIEW